MTDTDYQVPRSALPVGRVASEPIKGSFQALPIFGWLSVVKRDVPRGSLTSAGTQVILGIATLILDSVQSAQPKGTFCIEIPVLPETQDSIVAYLERLGWDGRIWPRDSGWPDGSDTDVEQLTSLMLDSNLTNIIVFSPGEHGVPTVAIDIQKARGPFYMPPLPQVPVTDQDKALKFEALVADPTVFDKPKPVSEEEKVRTMAGILQRTNMAKIRRQAKNQCSQFGILFDGIEDRVEDLRKIAPFVLDSSVRVAVRECVKAWGEDEKKILQEVLRVALLKSRETVCLSCSKPSDTDVCSECEAKKSPSSFLLRDSEALVEEVGS